MKTVRIGLFGCGVVGSGVIDILHRRADWIARRTGCLPRVAKICVREPHKERGVDLGGIAVTTDGSEILGDPFIDVVIEVIGGERDALGIISRSLVEGKGVITANKLVMAQHLPRLLGLEEFHDARLLYGASVCGSVPILKVIDETLAVDRITAVRGVLNGSTNFILGRLSQGCSWEEALQIAREQGFLEADPSLDLSGADAAQKLSILAYHAFGVHIPPSDIPTTGIEEIRPDDVLSAVRRGERIKLVAEARITPDGPLLSVAPHAVPEGSPLASVENEVNIVEVECDGVGTQRFQGKGAGSLPTANAVITDLLDLLVEKRAVRVGGTEFQSA